MIQTSQAIFIYSTYDLGSLTANTQF